MAKKKEGPIGKLLGAVIWLTGILVSLAVAFGMIDGVLAIRWIPNWFTALVGWVVVITTLLGVILAIAKQYEKDIAALEN